MTLHAAVLPEATRGEGQQVRQLDFGRPQFHENHVLTGTLAFNLLMGRGWPPDAEALRRAEQVCARLGLAELLRKMPGGLLQMVGHTGWQLSHGERSRLYMARALLQDADLVVLDESFAALDPRSLRQCLDAALDLAASLAVIAHSLRADCGLDAPPAGPIHSDFTATKSAACAAKESRT